ncbi:DUF6368 family protein [Chitinimonas sp.]|uniref:DUF6368 family protein n=1 Tax=Chitinimonas sp. TaxID=1934313 RepID=UPI0035B3663E
MAGACIAVLFYGTPTSEQQERFARYITTVASSSERQAFWICGLPFSYSTQALNDDEIAQYSVVGGFNYSLVICAGARGVPSDVFLAMLAAKVAEMFSGQIVFEGGIPSYTSDPVALTLEGRTACVGYDLLSATYLSHWINHQDFGIPN